jgi:hypothetical protein
MLILEDSLTTVAWPLHFLGTAILYLALALGLYSGGQYLASFWRQVVSKYI